jgi:hypothetical protein
MRTVPRLRLAVPMTRRPAMMMASQVWLSAEVAGLPPV